MIDVYYFTVTDESCKLSNEEIKEIASNKARNEADNRNWSWFKVEFVRSEIDFFGDLIYEYKTIGQM